MIQAASESELRFCTERHLAGPGPVAAAIGERPDNVRGFASGAPLAIASPVPAMAVVIAKLWRPGRKLKISFIGPVDEVVRQKIKAYGAVWQEHANLDFAWVSSGGDIRIACTPGGSWSYVGTDALLIAKDQPTMNFGWFGPTTDEAEFSRVILHEFGHALGAIHEHQHPQGGIPWDKPKLYAYYARLGWDKAEVDTNIIAKYASDQLNLSAYDRDSIMHYPVPNELTIGDFEVGWNSRLSAKDQDLAKIAYP